MTNEERVLAWLDEKQEELYGCLSRLIQTDTQNYRSHGLEAAGQRLVWALCAESGWNPEMYSAKDIPGIETHPGWLPGRGMDARPNVSALLPGTAPRRRIMLAAHVDTMPVGDPKQWTVPPLGGTIRDGRVWGRGASDNKGGLASALYALKALQACGIRLRDDVVFTSYADEEYGGGDGALAACLRYPCDVYVNLDGQDMNLCPWGVGGGIYDLTLCLNGSTETAVPAFEAARRVLDRLKTFAAARDEEFARSSIYRDSREREQCMRVLEVSVGCQGNDLGIARVTFAFYTLKSRGEIEGELADLRESVIERLAPLDFTVGALVPQTRFFIPYLPEMVCPDARTFGEAFAEIRGEPARVAGACLSDLSVFGNFGGGAAFNHGLVKGFEQRGGAHQSDENILCKDLLDETKAIALYLIRAAM